jgi:leader peptidase (prepilin peptidase)/N-methyltransferase
VEEAPVEQAPPLADQDTGDGAAEPARPPADRDGGEDDWVPPRHAIPYGPFLALAALQWLFLARPLARLLPVLSIFLGR